MLSTDIWLEVHSRISLVKLERSDAQTLKTLSKVRARRDDDRVDDCRRARTASRAAVHVVLCVLRIGSSRFCRVDSTDEDSINVTVVFI